MTWAYNQLFSIMQSTKKTTTAMARVPKPKQLVQPNKTCKCGACELLKPKLPEGVRRLKVYSKYAAGYNQVPLIMLQGEWLRNTGFEIGDEVLVTVTKKQLIVSFEDRN